MFVPVPGPWHPRKPHLGELVLKAVPTHPEYSSILIFRFEAAIRIENQKWERNFKVAPTCSKR